MHGLSPLLERLINSFCCLPGVGPKSAQRMVFHLLQRNREGAASIQKLLAQALTDIGHCKRCRIFSETEYCKLCTNPKRDRTRLCIVESAGDVLALEQTNHFNGLYFVLLGHLSPLDGIGPEELGFSDLHALLKENDIQEVILATNPTVEGEATAHYIASMVRAKGISASRIAYGVPFGGELESTDGSTLTRAFIGRAELIGELE